MKWSSFLVVAFVSLNFLLPGPAWTESDSSASPVVIEKISHNKDSEVKETIIIKLSGVVAPKIFILRGEKPRLVVDLPQTVFRGSSVIALENGVLASAVRLGLHQTPVVKTRAVVDLTRETKVQYTSDYRHAQNELVLSLTTEATRGAEVAKVTKDIKNGAEIAKTAEVVKEKGSEAVQPVEKSMPELKKESKKEVVAGEVVANKVAVEKQVLKKSLQEEIKKTAVEPKPKASEVKTEEKSVAKAQVAPVSKKPLESDKPAILEINFDDSSAKGEMVLFRLNDFYPPTVAAIETGTPRILCDFEGMEMGAEVEENIKAEGKYIDRIRTARHKNPDKVRVVLDLNPDRDYDLQQVFFRNDNLFVLIVNELPPAEVEQQ